PISFFSTSRPPPRSPLFPYTTLFRSLGPRLGRVALQEINFGGAEVPRIDGNQDLPVLGVDTLLLGPGAAPGDRAADLGEGQFDRSEEHTSELQSRFDLVCRLLLEKKK